MLSCATGARGTGPRCRVGCSARAYHHRSLAKLVPGTVPRDRARHQQTDADPPSSIAALDNQDSCWLLIRRIREREPRPSWRNVTIVAYTGLRGVVSLAAALALPLEVAGGTP